MDVVGLVVAAGCSSRMKEYKPVMEIDSISMIRRIVNQFDACGVRETVVVTGYNRDVLMQHLDGYPVRFVDNPDYKTTEMFDSVKLGLSYIMDNYGGVGKNKVLFTPVDIPLISRDTIIKLLENTNHLVKPVCHDRGGHPIRIDMCVVPSILSYSGKDGLKGALSNSGYDMFRMNVEDEGVLMDADTQQDFSNLVRYQQIRKREDTNL